MMLLFGHWFGDYVLQPKWMAEDKSKSTLVCALHCLAYCLAIIIVSPSYTMKGIAIVFVTHFLIDRFSLAWLYMRHVLGWPENPDGRELLFLPVVYVVLDNGAHLFVLYLLWLAELL